MSGLSDELRSSIDEWVRADPDPGTRAEVARLVEDGDDLGLADRFTRRLEFGTAGLRGAEGAGPNRMNRLVVRQTAAGLMRWLPDGATVVIGYDARPTSEAFADETAAVVGHFGGVPVVGQGPMPTPALAHAVMAHGAHAGVMVTASHNPRGDNGYKVYMADGAQLIPPADAEIEAAIVAAAETTLALDVERQPRVDMVTPYLDAVERHLVALSDQSDLRIVYTAMHGVGSAALRALFARLGLPAPVVVSEQDEPDGTFPTTAFPNPEEPGALDLAFALADRVGADLVIANDPDADRLGIALPGPEGWARLTGDELGLLLADSLLRRTTGDDRIVASSLVSSSALEVLAARHGVPHESTLTGFKWVARVGRDSGRRLVFGYEEALGYAVTPAVHDKDGITAAAELVHIAADRKRQGSDLRELLDEIMAEIGVFVTAQRTQRVEGTGPLERLAAAMASLRSTPPPDIGGVSITATEDLLVGDVLPPSDVLIYRLLDGSRVILRPSGTEPKLKAYLEVTAPAGPDGTAATRSVLTGRIGSLAESVEELLEARLD